MWLDDYTALDRKYPGVYILSECCIGHPRGGGSCRCVSHERWTTIETLTLTEAVRRYGAAIVREVQRRSLADAGTSVGAHPAKQGYEVT